jgi:hypothetical protein
VKAHSEGYGPFSRKQEAPVKEPTIEVPVNCPSCSKEGLCSLSVAPTAAALLSHRGVKLKCACQTQWNATDVEREQIREYLAMLALRREADFVKPRFHEA